MFKKNPTSVRLTLRALGYLLSYPDAQLRSVMPQLIDALQAEQALTNERMAELKGVCEHLAALDPMEAEARYVDNFDRGRRLRCTCSNMCMATRATGGRRSST